METATQQLPPLLLRSKELQRLTGLSASTLWRLEKAGQFPKRRRIGGSAVWLYSEVAEAIAAAPKGADL